MREMLRWGCILFGVCGVTTALVVLASITPVEMPRYGHRGAERQRAMASRSIFAMCEPVIRLLAALIASWPIHKLRIRQTRLLECADDVLGLSADELTALSLLSGGALGIFAYALALVAGVTTEFAVLGLGLGLMLPTLQLNEVIRQRSKIVTRTLPPAIEIAAMCMSAGLDFPGALRMLADRSGGHSSPLAREFAVILEQLDLGHTRKMAFERFAARVPSRAVGDFVNAVIQAEQKGNPLARVLQVQGRMLNMRRSVLAEESAARAGVLMIVPMVLLVGAILLLLMGPFMVKGIGW